MKVKNILSLALAAVIITVNIGVVSAASSTESVEYDEGIVGSNETQVSAFIDSEFKVTIPKTIVLSGQTKQASYTVTVEGDIAGEESVLVVPDDSFNLNSVGKAPQTATVTQDKTEWSCNEFNTVGNGTVSAGITAGKWSGVFNFNISISGGTPQPFIPSEYTDVELNDTVLNQLGYTKDKIDRYNVHIYKDNVEVTELVIPEFYEYEGEYYRITSIGSSAFEDCTSLTSVNLPNSVTDIRNNAFFNCTSLTSIDLPNSLKTIRNSVFAGCMSLTSIEIPDSVTSIGMSTFVSTKLTSIKYKDVTYTRRPAFNALWGKTVWG